MSRWKKARILPVLRLWKILMPLGAVGAVGAMATGLAYVPGLGFLPDNVLAVMSLGWVITVLTWALLIFFHFCPPAIFGSGGWKFDAKGDLLRDVCQCWLDVAQQEFIHEEAKLWLQTVYFNVLDELVIVLYHQGPGKWEDIAKNIGKNYCKHFGIPVKRLRLDSTGIGSEILSFSLVDASLSEATYDGG